MRKWIILLFAVCVTAAADHGSKAWIIAKLALYESLQPIPALAPFLQFTRSSNTGAAFGILPAAGNLFLLLGPAVILAMLWFMRGVDRRARFLPVAIGLVMGGALGNIIDRLQYGHVIDFIHYQIPGVISNVSNLADHAIVLGVLLLIGESLWRERGSKPDAEARQGP